MVEKEKTDDGYAREYDCEDGEYQRHDCFTRCTSIKGVKLVYEIPRDTENYHSEDPLDQSNNPNSGLWECCYHGGRGMFLARLFKLSFVLLCPEDVLVEKAWMFHNLYKAIASVYVIFPYNVLDYFTARW